MAFELKRKETVADGVRRVACEQIERALRLLDGSPRKGVGDKAVHEARKHFKQLRGALRLVRKDLGSKRFDRENRAFRDAGRPLSEVRDAKVIVDTLDELIEHYKGQLAAGTFKRLRGALLRRRRAVRERVLADGRAARSIVGAVRKSARRVAEWPLRRKGWKGIAAGLRRTYQRGREAMDRAIGDGLDEAYHEWRKRTKDLRYAVELLGREWPEPMGAMAESAHGLSDLLGRDHDLAVLWGIVDGELKGATGEEERELLRPLVSERRAELREQAIELGRKIYAEGEEEFVSRMHEYWKAWRG